MANGHQVEGLTVFDPQRNKITINSPTQVIDFTGKVDGAQFLITAEVDSFVQIIGTTIKNSANDFKVSSGEAFILIHLQTGSYIINGRVANAIVAGVPVPPLVEIKYMPYSDAKKGNYYKLDGQAISRVENASVFLVWGTTFGVGDGSTTFNLPDLAGKSLAAVSTLHVINSFAGEETHTLTTAEMPSHSHTGTTNADGQHIHRLVTSATALNGDGIEDTNGGDGDADSVDETTAAGQHSHSLTTNTTGNSAAHNNLPPTAYLGSWYVLSL